MLNLSPAEHSALGVLMGWADQQVEARLARCAFCSDNTLDRCAWPVQQFIPIPAETVEAGDVTTYGSVFSVARGPVLVELSLRFRASVAKLVRYRHQVVETKRPAPCGYPCCERHMVRREYGRVFCAEHWHAWEEESYAR